MSSSYSFKNTPYVPDHSAPLGNRLEFTRCKDEIPFDPNSRIEKILKRHDECVHQASSDLKKPLSKLQTYLSKTLKAQEEGQITADEMHYRLLKAENQCLNLTKIIDELIDLSGESSADQLKIQRQETNICNIAADVAERFLDEAIENKCQINLECPEPVVGLLDARRIDQVMTQLISNAIKFAPGSAIKMRISRNTHQAILEVSDNGPGIAFSRQSIIFDRFTKLDDSTKGYGVGLWLVKGIVERFSGTISISSWPGQGTKFTIKLPLQSLLH